MHVLANPHRFLKLSAPVVPAAFAVTVVAGITGAVWGLFLSPPDYQHGDTVRIMYVHVPSAWMALFAYGAMTVASIANLVWRHPVAGLAAKAAAGPGLAFTGIALLTGSIWGKPMWGAWWVWGDARLTSMLVLFFIYLGYLVLWRALGDPMRAMRPAAILCLVGAIDLPIVKFSVDWWSTLHQPASVIRIGGPTIHPSLLGPLLVMAIAFMALFLGVWLMATRTEIRRVRIRALRTSGERLARAR